ncbi:MAG: hypothetical protein G01um101429_882 [Parcubacteria group bacterium Gr01-1014_29]|nr:MAG: hypothetical protein G01um101429_882 [Parcubacteria group bacterium Gr01-1014_29]
MKRTQIQLDEHTRDILRKRAFHERRSVSDVIREALRESIHRQEMKPFGVASFSFIGAGVSRGKRSGRISEKHDEELGEAFGPKKKV